MGCFGCLGPADDSASSVVKASSVEESRPKQKVAPASPIDRNASSEPTVQEKKEVGESKSSDNLPNGDIDRLQSVSLRESALAGTPIAAKTFTFEELSRATAHFSSRNFVGEGGFGRVYKGRLESTGQIVAVKQLDRNGLQGNREFLVEVLMLSLLHHPNLVNLIGYCAEGEQRLLVYEFMPKGALEDHLHDVPDNKEPLDWNKRMKIAAGAARGLEYLHDKANPPVIYRDFKSSNILLDENWHPKLSDFGLAKLGPTGDNTHVSTRVMGTYGYCAPEYAMTGKLTLKSDVYSFGVVLLELITGRRAIDESRPPGEHNLVTWARPLFKERRSFAAMADPLLRGRYPARGLYQALAVAAMCVQEQASQRPLIGDVVNALSYLASQNYDPNAAALQSRLGPATPQHEKDKKGSWSPMLMTFSPRESPVSTASTDRGGGQRRKDLIEASSAASSPGKNTPGRGGAISFRENPDRFNRAVTKAPTQGSSKTASA
eukprot:TRINITY_DN1664_c0_g1_i1.p1 TRINITY_DN1664_c0_g1~~TRINITY_DN1664_c0_g1_i1.p1  ORF type:complete len:490 (+),score=30.56 TRINITY_DN1664_c0_g1_i1:203-1672(+)